jgi:hypothetical protein
MDKNSYPEVTCRQIKKEHDEKPSFFDQAKLEERESLETLTNGTYDYIDFTLLYRLMRSLSIINKPTEGWGIPPKKTDITISDDVERLRFIRNRIIHRSNAEIEFTEMIKCFSNIDCITQRIDTYLCKLPDQGFFRKVRNLRTCCIDPEMKQKYYQDLKDKEDMKGSKLLVFQVYLINLGGLSWPRLCRKKESPKFEDRHTMSKRKGQAICLFLFV